MEVVADIEDIKTQLDELAAAIDLENEEIKRIEMIEAPRDYVAMLQKRAQLIAESAMFRTDSEVVPVAGSVTTLFDIGAGGEVSKRDLNVLGLNYWGISKILSR